MSKLYLYKENHFSPCCNLIIWDFLFTVLFVASIFPDFLSDRTPITFTGFQSFAIGVIGGIILLGLMVFRILRNIIMILFSIFWGLCAYELLDEIFHISDYSVPWRYGIGLFLFLIILAIHFGSAEDLDIISLDTPTPSFKNNFNTNFNTSSPQMDAASQCADVEEDIHNCEQLFNQAISLTDTIHALPEDNNSYPLKIFIKQNASKIVRQFNHQKRAIERYNKSLTESALHHLTSVLDDSFLVLEEYTNTLHDMLLEYQQNMSKEQSGEKTYENNQQNNSEHTSQNTTQSSYFKGCDTLEKLNKRYRDLVKVYHSDSGNGNDEVFIEITDQYNQLKNKFSQ